MSNGFSIGPLFIHYYGILIMLGALGATWMADRLSKRYQQPPDMAWDVLPWALIGGIIGARIWHVLTPPASMVEQGLTTVYYLTHPLDILMIWRGGLGIPGAVMGGAIALWFYTRSHKANFALWIDIIAPGLALAQAVGRLGNFVNQELYGQPTSLPWAVYIDAAHRLPGFETIEYYHPLFFYEAIWNLLNMALLLWLGKRLKDRLIVGDIFLIYLIVYPVGRFLLEFLRLDPSNVGGINANQTLMASLAVISALALVFRHRFGLKGMRLAQAEAAPFASSVLPDEPVISSEALPEASSQTSFSTDQPDDSLVSDENVPQAKKE